MARRKHEHRYVDGRCLVCRRPAGEESVLAEASTSVRPDEGEARVRSMTRGMPQGEQNFRGGGEDPLRTNRVYRGEE